MVHLKRLYFGILCFAAVLLAVSCREECHYKPRAFAVAEFYSLINNTVQNEPVDSLSVRGLGMEDSLLYNAVNNIREISLPLDGNSAETGFIIDFDRGTDTVWFSYEVIPWFHSVECGFILNYNINEARHTSNVIDSVVIVLQQVTVFPDTNIRIYNQE